jgi:hypothetical protein
MTNPLYSASWTDHLITKYLFALPLISFVLLHNILKLSNQAVENDFRYEKQIQLQGKSNLKPGRYVVEDITRIKGVCAQILHNVPKQQRPKKMKDDMEEWAKRDTQKCLGKKKQDTSFSFKNLSNPNILSKPFHALSMKKGGCRQNRNPQKPRVVKECTQKNNSNNNPNFPILDIKGMQLKMKQFLANKTGNDMSTTGPNHRSLFSHSADIKTPLPKKVNMTNKNITINILSNGVVSDPSYYLNSHKKDNVFVCRIGTTNIMQDDYKTLERGGWVNSYVIDAFISSESVQNQCASISCNRSKSILGPRGTENKETMNKLKDFYAGQNDPDITYVGAIELDVTKNEDLISYEYIGRAQRIVMPYNVSNVHWILLFADKKEQSFIFYDPFCHETEETKTKFHKAFQKMWDGIPNAPSVQWKLKQRPTSLGQQDVKSDGVNCGVYILEAVLILCGLVSKARNPDILRSEFLHHLLRSSCNVSNRCGYCGNDAQTVNPLLVSEGDILEPAKCQNCLRLFHRHCSRTSSANESCFYNFVCVSCKCWQN